MLKNIFTSCVLCACFLNISVWPQHPQMKFERISIEQGLSQSKVFAVLQDRKGFIWVGTQDGLNKYDAYSFTIYRHHIEDTTSLSDNYVWSLCEDHTGTLWVGTNGGGLNRFDRATERFIRYTHDPNDSTSLSDDYVWTIFEDRAGTLWIGTRFGGLNRFDRNTGTFTRFMHDPKYPSSLSFNYIMAIHEDRKNNLWIGTNGGGLDKFDRTTGTFSHYRVDPKIPGSLSENRVWAVYEDLHGILWVGTNNAGLHRLLPSENKFVQYKNNPKDPYSVSSNWIKLIFEDSLGRLWIGTNNGLDLYNREEDNFSVFRNDPLDERSLSNNAVNASAVDRTGIIWLGTYGGGLNKYDPNKEKFRHYDRSVSDPNSISGNQIVSIFEDHEGWVWIGTDENGLDRMDRKTNTFTHYLHRDGDPSSLGHNRVLAIYEDREKTLWVGTRGGGLSRFNRNTNTFTNFKLDKENPNSPVNNIIYLILEDRKGNFWVATRGKGLNRFDRKTGEFIPYKYDPQSLTDNIIYTLCETGSGDLWVGTNGGGLVRINTDSNLFKRYTHSKTNPSSISHNIVLSMHEDRAGFLWIGTSGGLNRFDIGSESFTRFTEKDGLPNDAIFGILDDGKGHLWLSSNKGLSRFDPNGANRGGNGKSTGTFRNYDVADGLQSNEFNQGAYWRARDGHMFFGGINGFNVFHPDSIRENRIVPPIVLTGFKKFNKDVQLDKNISVTEEIELSYRDYVFSFEFAALNFCSTEKNTYAYLMEGFDKEWNYVGNRRFASYTNLNPGEYVFRVKGANSDGVWNEQGASVRIVIAPPFWQTWWFRIVIASFIFGVAFGIYSLRISNIEKQKNLLEVQVRERTREILEKNKILDQQNTELADKNQQIRHQQAEIIQSRKMTALGQMVAGIAHEINNPLTFVKGNLDHFRQTLHEFIKSKEYDALPGGMKEMIRNDLIPAVHSSLVGSNRIKDIVENLKRFSAINESEWKEADVNSHIEIIIDLFIRKHTDITIIKDYGDLPLLWCFVSDLNQCFVNILNNSVQAIRDAENRHILAHGGGMIRVKTEKDISGGIEVIRIRFSDNGVGIPQNIQEKIFDPFFTTRETGSGKGLGLTEAFGIIQKHRGRIEVISEEKNGSEFVVTLPLRASDLSPT